MKYLFSTHMVRFPRHRLCVVLGTALLVTILGIGSFSLAPTVHAAVASTTPMPPSGFTPSTSQDLSQLYRKDPRVHVETLTLSASQCAALPQAQPSESCQVLLYWSAASHLPLPRGTQANSAAYWYWSSSYEECAAWGTQCWAWSFNLTVDGVANGAHVWQWNEGCTAGGYEGVFNPSAGDWCGYLYNGGGWPNYAMQFGMNGRSCLFTQWAAVCNNRGLRLWINDWGNPSSWYSW